MDSKIVGVKLPESGWGKGVAEEVGDGEKVAMGEGVTVAEGVETKAGPSAAATTKFLVRVLKIPLASFQEMVTVWGPSGRFSGTFQLQSPEAGTVRLSVIGSDSTVI